MDDKKNKRNLAIVVLVVGLLVLLAALVSWYYNREIDRTLVLLTLAGVFLVVIGAVFYDKYKK